MFDGRSDSKKGVCFWMCVPGRNALSRDLPFSMTWLIGGNGLPLYKIGPGAGCVNSHSPEVSRGWKGGLKILVPNLSSWCSAVGALFKGLPPVLQAGHDSCGELGGGPWPGLAPPGMKERQNREDFLFDG